MTFELMRVSNLAILAGEDQLAHLRQRGERIGVDRIVRSAAPKRVFISWIRSWLVPPNTIAPMRPLPTGSASSQESFWPPRPKPPRRPPAGELVCRAADTPPAGDTTASKNHQPPAQPWFGWPQRRPRQSGWNLTGFWTGCS